MTAETAAGAVPMLPLGRLDRAGDGLTITFQPGSTNEAGWADLLKASRIFGIVVNLPEQTVRTMRVWLWRGAAPSSAKDWIDVTGNVTQLDNGRGYQITFRDISGEPALQHWARGEATARPAILTVHPHDNGFAIGTSEPATGGRFRVGVGVPGSTIYAIRFGR
jgi:hypothetical protein